ncbi:MAG: hypothetical protein R3249_03220 [Nitriliruptorales bacterium]|nr:hypothetical protein [Nitriliruptorales bacterium]
MQEDTQRRARQERLAGFEEPEPALFDDAEPIPFALTARARDVVSQAPTLHVVDGDAAQTEEEQLDDPRSVQARALRRAGMPLAAIAKRLDVDGFTVRAWLGGRAVPAPVLVEDPADAESRPDVVAGDEFDDRLAADAVFSAGVALLGAISDVDGGAVVLATNRPAPLAQALTFLRDEFSLTEAHVRVVLRLGPAVAADRAVNDWAAVLGVAAERIRHVRSSRITPPDAVEVLVRVTGPQVAARVGAWMRHAQRRQRPSPLRGSEATAG